MVSKKYSNPQVPVLKFTLTLILLISALFPVLTAIINDSYQTFPLHENLFKFIINTSVTFILSALESTLIFYLINLSNKVLNNVLPLWVKSILELLVCLFVTFWLLYGFFISLVQPVDKSLAYLNDQIEFRQFLGVNLLGALFIYLFESSLLLYQLTLQKHEQTEWVRTQYSQVRLQALRHQVNPHFLFNSLSVLSSLVHISAEQSEKFVIQLSKAYRYILDQKDIATVSLAAELEFLEAYFYLLQIRFENKVQLHISLDLDTTRFHIPPLTLQLLIENAVKHNKMSAETPLIIQIFNKGERLFIVNNYNKRLQTETSTGIGLKNIQTRYNILSKEPVTFHTAENCFEVQIPLLKKEGHESSYY